jgi:hypothetical protein
MTQKQRLEIEGRLSSYNIPIQILQMVADRCECEFDTRTKSIPRKSKLSTLLPRLNDGSILLLEQIFLDCHDSYSSFRLAVFLSSRYSPMMHKFVMGGKIAGKSGRSYFPDVCIYSRNTEGLVALALQNNDKAHRASDKTMLTNFLRLTEDVIAANPGMQGAYFSSSYGYQDRNRWYHARRDGGGSELRFFEYREKVYLEINSP